MSFISDDVIDPELLRQSQAGTAVPGDPAMRFLLQARSGAHVPSIGNSSGTFNPANEDEDEDLEDIPDRISAPLATTHRNLAAATNTSVVSNLITFGNTIKCAKKFESRTEGEFDKYCSVSGTEYCILHCADNLWRRLIQRSACSSTLLCHSKYGICYSS